MIKFHLSNKPKIDLDDYCEACSEISLVAVGTMPYRDGEIVVAKLVCQHAAVCRNVRRQIRSEYAEGVRRV